MLVSERGYRSCRSRPISCRVVGWAVSDRMKKDLAIRALDMAVRLRQPPDGCIFHSDRGSQYCSYGYQKKLQAYGLQFSGKLLEILKVVLYIFDHKGAELVGHDLF